MKFAIIGCEHAHIEIFIQEMLALGHTCAGIYEPGNLGLAASVSEKFRIPVVHDREQLLADPDVTVIGSAAINNEKIEIVERCEQAGKHVMLDKPAVTNRRDLERLRAVMKRGRIEVGMLLTERFHPAIYTLKQQIAEGSLGRLVSIGMRKPHLLRPARRPQWFFSKEQCGGIVIDLFIHDMDLLRWFTGREVSRTDGFMAKYILPEYPGFYDAASLQILMEGGVTAQLYADWHTPEKSWTWGDGRIFVTGTEGFAELRLSGDPFVNNSGGRLLMLRTTNTEVPLQVELSQPPTTITEDFLRRIAGNPSLLAGEDILSAIETTIDADERVTFISALQETEPLINRRSE